MTTAFTRRMRTLHRHHQRRAAADGQRLDYSCQQLAALVQSGSLRPCPYCGCLVVPGQEGVDHRHPISRSGAHRLANLVVCCRPCNERKGALTEGEYRALLALVRAWPPAAQVSILSRLRAEPKWRRKR